MQPTLERRANTVGQNVLKCRFLAVVAWRVAGACTLAQAGLHVKRKTALGMLQRMALDSAILYSILQFKVSISRIPERAECHTAEMSSNLRMTSAACGSLFAVCCTRAKPQCESRVMSALVPIEFSSKKETRIAVEHIYATEGSRHIPQPPLGVKRGLLSVGRRVTGRIHTLTSKTHSRNNANLSMCTILSRVKDVLTPVDRRQLIMLHMVWCAIKGFSRQRKHANSMQTKYQTKMELGGENHNVQENRLYMPMQFLVGFILAAAESQKWQNTELFALDIPKLEVS